MSNIFCTKEKACSEKFVKSRHVAFWTLVLDLTFGKAGRLDCLASGCACPVLTSKIPVSTSRPDGQRPFSRNGSELFSEAVNRQLHKYLCD